MTLLEILQCLSKMPLTWALQINGVVVLRVGDNSYCVEGESAPVTQWKAAHLVLGEPMSCPT